MTDVTDGHGAQFQFLIDSYTFGDVTDFFHESGRIGIRMEPYVEIRHKILPLHLCWSSIKSLDHVMINNCVKRQVGVLVGILDDCGDHIRRPFRGH